MQVTISCELYARMAAIPLSRDPQPGLEYCRSIFIERKLGSLYVVATNIKIAAIEYLGRSDGPDEYMAIIASPEITKQCELETEFNSTLNIVCIPEIQMTTIKSTMGYQATGNAWVPLPVGNMLAKWRDWVPNEQPTATKGAMFWNMELIEALAKAAPSGGIVFPEFIDTSTFIVVNDHLSSDWIGVFNGAVPDDNEVIKAAIVPDWKL